MKISKLASTLLKEDIKKVPSRRLRELRKSLRDELGIKRLTKDKIIEMSKSTPTVVKRTHGEIVMSNVTDIQSFVEMWRSHFVENNDCPYLPKNWSIKTKIERNGIA